MFVRRFSFFKVCQKLLTPDNGGATGGAGTTTTTGTETTTGGGTGTTTTGGAETTTGGAETTTTTTTGAEGDKTFTQADIDKVVAERLAREKKKYEGVDVAEYKKLKADADAKAEAEKTELEKAQDKITKAESEKNQALQLANQRLILAEFKVIARDADIKYVNDAYKLADLSTVEVKEDGTIEGLKEIVDALIKEKPFLLEEVKGGTGKVDNTSKNNKGATGTSFGARLGEQRKNETKADVPKHYFK